jgi:hypothetical protein
LNFHIFSLIFAPKTDLLINKIVMKKVLLFMMAIGFAFSTFAQNKMVQVKNQLRVQEGQEVAIPQTHATPVLNTKAVNEDVNRIPVCTAAHERGVRREEAHVIAYNPDMDVITVTTIADPASYDNINEVGIISQFYSVDHGQSWVGPVVVANDLSQGPNYYLSGSAYNPAGNTNVDDMVSVGQGVIYPPTGDWRFKSYGSSTFAGANQTNDIFEETDPNYGFNGYWNIFGLDQIGDEMRCLNMIPSGGWGAFETAQLNPVTGTFDGSTFDWNFDDVVDADLYQGEADGVMSWIGMWQGMDAGTEMAWSKDGQTGYMWMVGVSNQDATGYQPIVFQTVDGGGSWDYVYLDFLSDEMQAFLEPYIIEATGGLMIPHVFESCGTVDANGDLQLLTATGSTSADVTIYPDSIGYHWGYPGDLFNITVDADGIKNILWVDSLNTDNVLADTPGNYCGSEGWQHRLSAAKSPDETQVFFTWIETRDAANNEFNLQPDVFGWSRTSDGVIMDAPVCFTENTLYEKFYYFTSGATYAYINADGGYTLPYLQAVTPGEFSSNTSTSGDPITLSYITGIEFPNLVDGIDELTSASGNISVSQNIPNPFTGETSIEVTTNTAAPVMVEVSNIMGQTVYTVNAGTINGTKNIQLNSENLESGVYFYTVTVGNESVTKKMIVK